MNTPVYGSQLTLSLQICLYNGTHFADLHRLVESLTWHLSGSRTIKIWSPNSSYISWFRCQVHKACVSFFTSRIPWPKLLSLYALYSGCWSQQNFPAAGPDVKLEAQNPPMNESGVVDGSGQFPGSSVCLIAIFSRFPPSPTVMWTGPHGSNV